MAYVLGFFAADGYITVNKRGGQFLCLDIKDKKLIESIKCVIQSEHKISTRIRHKEKFITYRLQIGSVEMCNDLRKLGLNENKTRSLSVPEAPVKYFSSFVRGYFDGDGNVWVGYMNKYRKKLTLAIQTVFTSCSFKFLEEMKRKLGNFKIERGVIRKGKGNYYRLTYSVNSSLKLYDFMYNEAVSSDNSLFLKRKRIVFEKFIQLRS